MIGEGETDCNWQSAADDCVPAVEPSRGVEEMHRAAPAPAAALDLAIHLGHDRARVHSASKGVAVLAIGCDDSVVRPECLHHTDGHSFLPDVEMEESPDLLGLIELCAPLLEPADPEHPPEKVERMSIIAHVVTCLPASIGRRLATPIPKL